jgi:exo-1,4-beta-D-glucosaminidase
MVLAETGIGISILFEVAMKTLALLIQATLPFVFALCLSGGQISAAPKSGFPPGSLPLSQGWTLQSSRKVSDGGEVISAATFRPEGWYRATIPATVLAAQAASGEFQDPYFGMNLRKIPGMTYPIGLNSFSNVPMDKNSPYAVSWWYRTEFRVPRTYAGRNAWLHFQGINYRANIWLNGRRIADSKEVQGAYRIYEFDITALLHPETLNVLALEIFAPTEKELGINLVDWSPMPPDKNMGVWGDVFITTSGPVSVRHPQVITRFPDRSLNQADLTVMAQIHNASTKPVSGVAEGVVDLVSIRQDVTLQPGETRSLRFYPDKYPQLRIKNPRLWWPIEMGEPTLHDVKVKFSERGRLSDEARVRFGIREITSELTDQGYRLFRVNGRRILIRGAGWAQDMMMRHPEGQLEAQIQYVLDMRLNTIRLEAMFEVDKFFDLCDEKGILVMAGWCCCDIWERWGDWVPGTVDVATGQLRTQILRMRGHPCMLAWLNGSDGPPPTNVEGAYVRVLEETAWPNPVINSASDATSEVTGPSGVKMTGPYDYEPPCYWLADHDRKWGGAYGFNTETGPGPAIPPLQSLRKMLPGDHLWPIDEVWNYHSAGERFQTMDRYHEAMEKTYGKPTGLEDYLRKSQAMAYDGERAMFEAYSRNKYTSTGVIQWMLNNPWPSTYWHLYDYYLYPAGGYFGTKKACEPLHVQYSYDDRSVVVVSSMRKPVSGLVVSARVFNLKLEELYSKEAKADMESDSTRKVLTIPLLPAVQDTGVYFVRLSLRDSTRKEISTNFYWLPATLSTLAWDKTPNTAFTPIATFENLMALNSLPHVRLEATARFENSGGNDEVRVTLRNPGRGLAFMAHAGVRKAHSEDDILPVLWEDNYVSLLPGESKELVARYLAGGVVGSGASVHVDGWNVQPVETAVEAGTRSKR